VGVTFNTTRRLRQHNGEIKGGARSTRGRQWRFLFLVRGLARRTALQLEWRLHRRGHGSRVRDLWAALTQRKRVTSKAQPTGEWTGVTIEWCDDAAREEAGRLGGWPVHLLYT